MASDSPKSLGQAASSPSKTGSTLRDTQEPAVSIKQELPDNYTTGESWESQQKQHHYQGQIARTSHNNSPNHSTREHSCSPPDTSQDQHRDHHHHRSRRRKDVSLAFNDTTDDNSNNNNMSQHHSGPSSFVELAYAYRLYILDDLLAEPQEVVYDYMRNLIYISQRYRQGNSVAPIELSHEIWVMDIRTAEIISTIDTSPYYGPHCLEMHESGSFITAYVDHGSSSGTSTGGSGSVFIDPDTGAVYDASASSYPTTSSTLAGSSSDAGGYYGSGNTQQQASASYYQYYSSPASTASSSSSSHHQHHARQRGDDFIAEIDLRSGKMRRRVNVSQSDNSSSRSSTHSNAIAFSAPAIRFASRTPSSSAGGGTASQPVLHVDGDVAVEALKARFGAKKIYATSRSVMLV